MQYRKMPNNGDQLSVLSGLTKQIIFDFWSAKKFGVSYGVKVPIR